MRYASHFTTVIVPAIALLLCAAPLRAQLPADGETGSFARAWDEMYREGRSGSPLQSPSLTIQDAAAGERKSGFLAVMYSLVLPGMGELYADRFDKGKYPLILEAGLWLGLIGVESYGNWIEDDARIFAVQHAGIDPAGKEDKFFVNIENYQDLADYNNQRLVERRLDEVYPDQPAWRWSWDSEANRLEYKDQRIRADEMHNAVTFFVLGMVANRIWSAIQAGISVRQHNASLAERLLGMPAMHAQLTSLHGRTDGMRLTFTW